MSYTLPFAFPQADGSDLSGLLELGEPEEAAAHRGGLLSGRRGAVTIASGRRVDLQVTHSVASSDLMYLRRQTATRAALAILDEAGLPEELDAGQLLLPGQLLLGCERSETMAMAVREAMGSRYWRALLEGCEPGEVTVFPVLREGVKFRMAEGVFAAQGLYCNEVVVDAHHVEDTSAGALGRRMELSIFKDADFSEEDRRRTKVAVVGDSVASGTVLVGLLAEISKRFPNLERIELVAPLAALFGLARIAAFGPMELPVTAHVMESVLNALEPDYYYSPFYPQREMHLRPDLYEAYRGWWGRDAEGKAIADTACAGFGWSEAFFSPHCQLRLIDADLQRRHGLRLRDVLERAPLGRRRDPRATTEG